MNLVLVYCWSFRSCLMFSWSILSLRRYSKRQGSEFSQLLNIWVFKLWSFWKGLIVQCSVILSPFVGVWHTYCKKRKHRSLECQNLVILNPLGRDNSSYNFTVTYWCGHGTSVGSGPQIHESRVSTCTYTWWGSLFSKTIW